MPESGLAAHDFTFSCYDMTLAGKRWQGTQPPELPLLALHGWMDNAGTFDNLVPRLGYGDVIAPDFSGHGLSSHRHASGDYYIWAYVEELMFLLEQEGISRCLLMGHSMGGAVATLFAALFPARVDRLVLLDSAGPLVTEEQALPRQLAGSLQEKMAIHGQRPRHYPDRGTAEQSRANSGITLASARILGERGLDHDDSGWFWRQDQQLKRRNPVSFSEAQVRACLRQVRAETLLVSAESSTLATLEGLDERLACVASLQHVRLPGNHFQHLEGQVDAVAEVVAGFLQL